MITQEKLQKVKLLHPNLRILNIDGKFLIVEDKYGICRVQVCSLLEGSKPTIATALDQTAYYKNKLFEANPNLTLVSDYKSSQLKILVKDKYGICEVLPGHVLKQVPCINTSINKSQYFINLAREIHEDSYDYSNTIYTNALTKVSIICKKHGEFKQDPFTHLKGKGCVKCGRETMVGFWYKNINNQEKQSCMYILKFKNNDEEFKKFGVTINLRKRLEHLHRETKHQYEITTIKIVKNTVKHCFALEKRFKKILKRRGVMYEAKTKFCGRHECFI